MNNHTSEELKQFSNKVKDHRMRIRLLAVAHFKMTQNRAEVARTLNVSRRRVNDWVANYLEGGIDALQSKKPSGRPSHLTAKQKESLVHFIDKQSQSSKGGRLNADSLQRYIQDTFDVTYHRDSIYKLLKSLNISWITSRSQHPRQSQHAQEEFKKTAN